MSLPKYQTDDPALSKLMTTWPAQIDPVLANPLTKGIFIKNIQLIIGVNVINHKLGRLQQGWIRTDIDSDANPYRSAPFNSQTLVLTSSATTMVSIYVF